MSLLHVMNVGKHCSFSSGIAKKIQLFNWGTNLKQRGEYIYYRNYVRINLIIYMQHQRLFCNLYILKVSFLSRIRCKNLVQWAVCSRKLAKKDETAWAAAALSNSTERNVFPTLSVAIVDKITNFFQGNLAIECGISFKLLYSNPKIYPFLCHKIR